MDSDLSNLNLKKAVLLVALASVSFSVMALFVKLAAKTISVDKIITFRFGISLIYLFLILGVRKIYKKDISLKTNNLPLQIIRAFFGMLGMGLLYTSLKYILIVNANLLSMTSALFIPIIGAIFFKEKVNLKHWLAITIGFLGVALIIKPNHDIFDFYSIIALLSGFVISFSFIFTRKLSLEDSHHVCMFYMFFITFLVSGTYSFFTWEKIDFQTFLYLLGLGIFGSLHQDFMIRASSYAPAKITSSLLYSALIFSIGLDFVFFNKTPNFVSWMGIALVIVSSVLTVMGALSQRDKAIDD